MIQLLIRVLCFVRGVSIILLYPVWVGLISALIVLASLLPESLSRSVQDWFVKLWGDSTLLWFGIRVHVEGLEELPTQRGVLFLINHTSHLDIPVFHHVFPHPRFGAKIELFKIPVFGRAMRAAGALPIARGQREKVFKVYKEAERRFAKGESFVLAPEGTRQSGKELGTFRSGPFVFAINAKVPVVPVVLLGVNEILPKGRLMPNRDRWRRDVRVKVLSPIDSSPYTLKDRPQFQEVTFAAMQAAFQQNY